MSEKITVIVPMYNCANTLRRAVDSIIGQTYENLEIILSDDGSTDGSSAICDEFAALDKRVRVLHNVNGGVSSARNKGLDAATGDYIGFLDSDDYIDAAMYEKLHSALKAENADIAFGRYYECDGDTARIYDSPGEQNLKLNLSEKIPNCLFHGDDYIPCSVCRQLIRRDLIGNYRFDESLVMAEDLLFTLHLILKRPRIAVVNEPLYYYTISDFDKKYLKRENFDSIALSGVKIAEELRKYGYNTLALHNEYFSYMFILKSYFLADEDVRNIRKCIESCRELKQLNNKESFKVYYETEVSGMVRILAWLAHHRLFFTARIACKIYKIVKHVDCI